MVDQERLFVEVDIGAHLEALPDGTRVAALVDGGDEFATRHGVSLTATCRTVPGAEGQRLAELMEEKYFSADHPYSDAYAEYGVWTGRSYVELLTSGMTAWDYRETSQPQGRESRILPWRIPDRLYARSADAPRGSVVADPGASESASRGR